MLLACGAETGRMAEVMTFLPVVERELRVAARKRGTYWGRMLAAAAGAGIAAWSLAASGGGTQVGAVVFESLAVVVLLYCVVSGLLFSSDCISEEKREGTLGLLFLTDLKGYDVVFGKLTSTSMRSLNWMLAALPALAISIILGAVSSGEIVRVTVVALNLFFFFLSVSLFASSLCQRDNRALGLSVMISMLIMTAIPALLWFRALPIAQQKAAGIYCPAFGAFDAFDAFHGSFSGSWFWWNCLVTQIYAWTLLGLACLIVPASWQASGSERKRKRKGMVKTKSISGGAGTKEVLAVNAFLWRATESGQRTVVWLMLAGVGILWFVGGGMLPGPHFEMGKDLIALGLAGAVLKVWLALQASATLSADRRNSALELLLTTPLPEKAIIAGQRMALWRQFAEPAVAVFFAGIVCLFMEVLAGKGSKNWVDLRDELVGLHLISAFSMLVDLGLLSWVAMWQGLVRRKPNHAAFVAVLQVLVVPYALFFVFYAIAPLSAIDPLNILVFTGLIGLVSGFLFAQHANSRLLVWFRRVVAEGKPPTLREAAIEEEMRDAALEARCN